MRYSDFLQRAQTLLETPVEGLTTAEKCQLLRGMCTQLEAGVTGFPHLLISPFVRGRRPWDEIRYAGYGSSEHTGLLLSPQGHHQNKVYILFKIKQIDTLPQESLQSIALSARVSIVRGEGHAIALPGWESQPLLPQVLKQNQEGDITLETIDWQDASTSTLVFAFAPNALLLPRTQSMTSTWDWNDIDASLQAEATDHQDLTTLGHMWKQTLRIELRLTHNHVLSSIQSTDIEVYDHRRMGSLYQRIVERLLIPDTIRQCKTAKVAPLDHAYHPWFPVLHIGAEKAALYMSAIYQDTVEKNSHLTDPRWLLRVGLYLELLTCLGIFEAVKDELGDLLTPAEREQVEQSPFFAPIRKALNTKAWKQVWALKQITLSRRGFPNAGPVSSANLLTKKKATLAFLHTHHEDLKQAIALAGPNEHNAQETWHRVFRDAERAVLRKSVEAFPELSALSDKAREFVMWHQQGKFSLLNMGLAPISQWFGDQDGLYASACNQYRSSMNEVAHWAKQKGLMDYTGDQCVPLQVSILQAYMNQEHVLLQSLQKRDGYTPSIDIEVALDASEHTHQSYEAVLAQLDLLQHLTAEERQALATKVRKIELGPMERIVIQGQPGSSLFVAIEGTLEVLARQEDGHDLPIATLQPPAAFGELSFLTGAPRSSTVRALGQATILEISASHLRPLIESRPQMMDSFAALMATRAQGTAQQTALYKEQHSSLLQRIHHYLFH